MPRDNLALLYVWFPNTSVWTVADSFKISDEFASSEGTIHNIAQRFVERNSGLDKAKLKRGSFLVSAGDIIVEYLYEDNPRAVKACA